MTHSKVQRANTQTRRLKYIVTIIKSEFIRLSTHAFYELNRHSKILHY